MDKEKTKLNLKYTEILPNNERVRQKMYEKEQREVEEKRKLQMEEERKKEDELLNEELQKKDEEERRKHLEEQKNMELDTKKAIMQIERGEGNMNELLKSIYRNVSTYEVNFSGLDLNDWDFHSLMIILGENMSVLTLNLCRKGLTDDKAKKLGEMLKQNKRLKRLELEGNLFTSEACNYFADALKKNDFLRYLDLQNNCLTDNGKNNDGIIKICNALEENTMLITLILSNNALDDHCAQKFYSMLRKNKSLIHLELFDNQQFINRERMNIYESKFGCIGSSVEHTESIKEKLRENRSKDKKWRLKEWKERKKIKDEDLDVQNNAIYLTAKKNEMIMKIEEKNQVLDFYKNKFDNELKDLEEQFQKDVEAFYIETRQRLDKKPNRNKPKKK